MDLEEKLRKILEHPKVRIDTYPLAGAKPEVKTDIIATVEWIDE